MYVDDIILSLQFVPVESAPPAVTAVNVMTATWVMAPASVTWVMGAWPVSYALRDSTVPPVEVSSADTVLFGGDKCPNSHLVCPRLIFSL